MELVGNLHSEAFVVPFLLFTLLAVHRSAWVAAGLALGLAMAVKLLAADAAGVFPAFLGWRRAWGGGRGHRCVHGILAAVVHARPGATCAGRACASMLRISSSSAACTKP